MTNEELIKLIQDYGMAMWKEGTSGKEDVYSLHLEAEKLFNQIATVLAER